ncbi:MAG: hypothetical protein WD342_04010 [Verrucomicrobiales bacterium]
MQRAITLSVLLAGLCLCRTGCGIAAHQLHRATNLLKAPVRALSTEAPSDPGGETLQAG